MLETLLTEELASAVTASLLGTAPVGILRGHPVLAHGADERLPELWPEHARDLDALLSSHAVAGGRFDARGRNGVGAVVESRHLDAKLAKGLLLFGAKLELANAHLVLPAVRSIAIGVLADLGLPSGRVYPSIDVYPASFADEVADDPRDRFVVGLSGELDIEVAERVRLGRGDVLFVRGGTPIRVSAPQATSWALTLLVRRPSVADLVVDALETSTTRFSWCRRPFEGTHLQGSAELEPVLASLREAAASLDPRTMLSRHALEGVVRPHLRVAGASLRVADAGRTAVVSDADANEVEIEIPEAAAPIFQVLLRPSRAVYLRDICEELPDVAPDLVSATLDTLVQAGLIEPGWLDPSKGAR